MSIKFNFNNVRKLKGISQQELGRLTGFSQSYISQLARETKSPSLMAIEKISFALRVEPRELLNFTKKLSILMVSIILISQIKWDLWQSVLAYISFFSPI